MARRSPGRDCVRPSAGVASALAAGIRYWPVRQSSGMADRRGGLDLLRRCESLLSLWQGGLRFFKPDTIACRPHHSPDAIHGRPERRDPISRAYPLWFGSRLGNTRCGMIGGVVLTSLLFAVLHITQIFAFGVSLSSALLLTLESLMISIWWGGLTLMVSPSLHENSDHTPSTPCPPHFPSAFHP